MNLVDAVSDSLFYRAEDGRITFRPWGRRGPCYLLSERQRVVRARVQLAYYVVLGTAFVVNVESVSLIALFGLILPLAVGVNYILYWVFTIGLGETTPPDRPSPEYIKAQIQRNSRAFGKPLLWVLLLVSLGFVLVGILIAVTGGPLSDALQAVAFFGVCAVLFARRLRSL